MTKTELVSKLMTGRYRLVKCGRYYLEKESRDCTEWTRCEDIQERTAKAVLKVLDLVVYDRPELQFTAWRKI